MRISDWSSDVCSSDLILTDKLNQYVFLVDLKANKLQIKSAVEKMYGVSVEAVNTMRYAGKRKARGTRRGFVSGRTTRFKKAVVSLASGRSEEHTSELQSLMRISYAVFCLKKKKIPKSTDENKNHTDK